MSLGLGKIDQTSLLVDQGSLSTALQQGKVFVDEKGDSRCDR